MVEDANVAIVGGGIAGTSVAYHLAGLGRPLALFERGDLGSETTAKSAAFFGEYGTPLERRLKRYGMGVYNDLFRAVTDDLRYEHVGRLRIATSEAGADDLRAYARNHGVRGLDPEEVAETVLVPHLAVDAIEFATYRPHVGYLRPRPLARAFALRARSRESDVRIETGEPVVGITRNGDRIAGLELESRAVTADHVVCAGGPWNPGLLREVDVDLPVSHSLAPVIRVDIGDPGYTLPIVSHHETGVYVRGHEDGTALCGRYPPDPPGVEYDPDDVPETVPGGLRETILETLGDVLPGVADAPALEEWVGVRSHTPDGHPIADEIEAGLSVVAFDSSGIQLAPAVGRAVARKIAGVETDFADALSLARFE